jgi:hypothetical protein
VNIAMPSWKAMKAPSSMICADHYPSRAGSVEPKRNGADRSRRR